MPLIQYDIESKCLKALYTKGSSALIEFHDGSMYVYRDRMFDIYEMLKAPSIGRYFNMFLWGQHDEIAQTLAL